MEICYLFVNSINLLSFLKNLPYEKTYLWRIGAHRGGGVIFTTLTATETENNNQLIFEQQPPIPVGYFVQKLATPRPEGNMILTVQYYPDASLPQELNIFFNGNVDVTLKDDGEYPDAVEGDYKYACVLQQDIQQFVADIQERESLIQAQGGVYHFSGHDGKFINEADIPPFDFDAFDANIQAPIYQPILEAGLCETSILKQNSLFITDLKVVEDLSRTYLIKDPNNGGNPSGNIVGAWTFYNIMKNIINENATGISPNDFLKSWLKTWISDQRVGTFADASHYDYDNVKARSKALKFLIVPWIRLAYNGSAPLPATIDGNNWEALWDNLDPEQILKYSPFRLMAIVNRLDLHGNIAYGGGFFNAGETRFIFTLIDPETGKPPYHDNIDGQSFGQGSNDNAIDWVGMNLILEFGNPISNTCELKNFAQQWYDLSAFPLGEPEYNEHLESITNQVIAVGAGGNQNSNHSALNQIRTNERMFDPVIDNTSATDWSKPDWELRQFELDDNGYLMPAVVTNTPVDDKDGLRYNNAENLELFGNTNFLPNDVMDFIYGPTGTSINRIRASLGNHNLPSDVLAGSAILHKEFTHFFGFDWSQLTTLDPNPGPQGETPEQLSKKIRHQVSLNTCQGCHGGETQTNFTQIYPRGYGEPANYWDPIPSIVTPLPSNVNPPPATETGVRMDARFYSSNPNNTGTFENQGSTFEVNWANPILNLNSPHVENVSHSSKTANIYNQIVSPFITGRRYNSESSSNWQDDELWDAGKESPVNASQTNYPMTFWKSDEKLTGFFFVNDPSNKSGTALSNGTGGDFPQNHTQRWGFNELEERKQKLCLLVNTQCGFEGSADHKRVLNILTMINHIPKPFRSH